VNIGLSCQEKNRVLRRILGLKRGKAIGTLHEELHNLYGSPNIIRLIKFTRMR
jgi:hypothetical protein